MLTVQDLIYLRMFRKFVWCQSSSNLRVAQHERSCKYDCDCPMFAVNLIRDVTVREAGFWFAGQLHACIHVCVSTAFKMLTGFFTESRKSVRHAASALPTSVKYGALITVHLLPRDHGWQCRDRRTKWLRSPLQCSLNEICFQCPPRFNR